MTIVSQPKSTNNGRRYRCQTTQHDLIQGNGTRKRGGFTWTTVSSALGIPGSVNRDAGDEILL